MRLVDQIEAIATPLTKLAYTPTVQIDFDGTMAGHQQSRGILGTLHPNAVALVSELHRLGYRVEILTANPNLDVVGQWLVKNGMAFALVTNVKHPAVAYLDDRAIRYTGEEPVDAIMAKIRELENQ